MSHLSGTQTTFDPLSELSLDDEVSVPAAAPAQALAPTPTPSDRAAAATSGPAADYDSFMTARSAMSHMSASTSTTQGAAPPSPIAARQAATGAAAPLQAAANPFRRLPDRDLASAPSMPAAAAPSSGARPGDGPSADPYNPFSNSPPPAAASDPSNPFASSLAPYPPLPRQPPHKPEQQHPAASSGLGPLSFGDDDTGGIGGGAATGTGDARGRRGPAAGVPDTTFAMPLDLYDTPDTFAQSSSQTVSPLPPAAAAASSTAAMAAEALPPLANFTRDLSRALPVSEDPISPPSGGSVTSPPPWYDSGNYGVGGGGFAGSAGPSYTGVGGGGGAGGTGGSGGAGGLLSYAAAALLTNTVSVHSPRKAVAPSRIPGLSEPYTVYRVTSRGATVSETTVDRRFRDVVALGELLMALYPGCFVPPRPSRNAVEGRRMQPAFIEERRQGMEKFLKRLVVHPVFGPSEVVQVWLRSPTPDLRSSPEWLRLQPAGPPGLARSTARLLFQVVGRERTVPSPLEVTRPASERGDMYRMVHERAAQLRGVLAKVQPSATEERLRQEAAAMQERTEALLLLSRRADHLVARGGKVARVTTSLAAALGALAGADEAGEAAAAGPTPRAALQQASDGCDKVGKLYGVANDASAKHLTPLNDWLAAVPGAAAGLAARERCLLTVATLEADEREARGRLAEAEGRAGAGGAGGVTSPSASKKVEGLRLQVSQLTAAVGAARDEYERVGGRNAAELAAYKAHMSRELADAVREFALVQLAAAQRAHEVWQETAAALVQLAAAAAAPPPGGASVGSGVALGVGLGGGSRGGSSSQLGYGRTSGSASAAAVF